MEWQLPPKVIPLADGQHGPVRDLSYNFSRTRYIRTALVDGSKAVIAFPLSFLPFRIGPLSLGSVPLTHSFQAISALAFFCRLYAGSGIGAAREPPLSQPDALGNTHDSTARPLRLKGDTFGGTG